MSILHLPESIYDVASVSPESGLVLGSLGVVFFANIVHSALPPGPVFVRISLLHLPLNADPVAVVQILIYAGAANALISFAVTLVASKHRSPYPPQSRSVVDAMTLALCAASGLLPMTGIFNTSCWYEISLPVAPGNFDENSSSIDGVQRIGLYLLTDFLLPFELLSVVPPVAPVGAIAVARRD
uniref:NADH dehydrogenase subunit G n=1 Tax=Selaginella kraussiana TaxID=81964 RepID=A0A3T0IAS6_9TRAC|nr:NADH dehydrogenase subunit G [Selaginella kraussiana]AZU95775.1 NADH dehydrogenase subunit G [Selaginella kraussiana]